MNDKPATSSLIRHLDQIGGPIGVAVSGGSDSLALLYLCVERFGAAMVFAVTVDHGLRPEAVEEAEFVNSTCNALGVAHTLCRWSGWDGQGNLMDRARRARYELIAQWARENGLERIALGHTADDLAETFMMRVARRAGLEGLSAMAERREAHGLTWLRPLLQVRRKTLQTYLEEMGVGWVNDPTNEDQSFERVRMRRLLAELDSGDLPLEAIADTARNLADAEQVVAYSVQAFLEDATTLDFGDVIFAKSQLLTALPEIRRRAMVHALKWVSGAGYGPRRATTETVMDQVNTGQDTTAHGCMIVTNNRTVRVTREHAAVSAMRCDVADVWDRRWLMTGTTEATGLYTRALGAEGLDFCKNWRETGRPRAALLASPSVWGPDGLIAAPLAGMANGWRAELSRTHADFYSSILSR